MSRSVWTTGTWRTRCWSRLVNQFGMMQQQMMDQFQQTVSMLVQMFGSMHRDQMDLIREELDQLRDLTKEFQTHEGRVGRASLGRTDPANSPELPAAPGVPRRRLWLRGPVCGNRRGIPSRRRRNSSRSGVLRTVPRPIGPKGSGARHLLLRDSSISPSPADLDPGEESHDADRDVIVWLHQRMMTLQQQRETRWQKILKLLPGLS